MSDQTPRVVVITGASQGIGASLVPAYRNLGYAVLGTSRTIRPSDDPMIATVQGDIATAETAERVTRHAIERFGRIDTLINNAGVFVAKRFTQYTDEDYDLVTGVNLGGFFHITRRAIEHMEGAGSGHVVNITTTLVEHANVKVPSALASLTKGGLAAVTKSLATEYAATGIRVNAVSPGVIKTPMHAPETHDGLGTLHPMGRMGETSDVVSAIMYLESAPFVTGEFMHVDGGQSAGH
ncbi:MAG: SDR family oxidoreductase [Actinomycetota bacterium]|jgi:NAD(P)-dependent dehydrogenase (short-subunit alcohol dehydrogenase family)|nr:SDR family oxidoreductase [Actinomycetota bacterium]